jgi:ATP-dependent RNA helicase DDX10/DBP4
VHSEAATATPQKLEQQYAVVDLARKVDAVWSFVRTHRQGKSVVFLATCKQVRALSGRRTVDDGV